MPAEPSSASIEVDGLLARVLERDPALGVTVAVIALADRATTWRGPEGALALTQTYQVLTGYAGAVDDGALVGTVERDGARRAWRATRA